MMEADDRYLAPTAATVRDSPNNSFVWTAGLLAAFAALTLATVWPPGSIPRPGFSELEFWPANGILTALFFLTRGTHRIVSGCVAAVLNFVSEYGLGHYTGIEAATATVQNLTEAASVVVATRYVLGDKLDFSRLQTLLRFTAFCVVPPILVCVTAFSPLWLSLMHTNFWSGWIVDFRQESLGILMVAPTLYEIAVRREQDLFHRSYLERIGLFAVLLASELILFGLSSTPILFAVFPLLVGISFRLGPGGAALAVLLTTATAYGFARLGLGPFATLHQAGFGVAGLLQLFVLAVICSVLPAAGAVAQNLRSQEELKRLHKELIDVSRLAGRAEIANNVLHNVSNVLNSVTTSTNVLLEDVQTSDVANLTGVASLLENEDLISFANSDQGKGVPEFLSSLGEQLSEQKRRRAEEMTSLMRHIEHVNEIVAAQQIHAARIGSREAHVRRKQDLSA